MYAGRLPRASIRLVQTEKGGIHMSDYEIIMILLTVLLVVFTAIGTTDK